MSPPGVPSDAEKAETRGARLAFLLWLLAIPGFTFALTRSGRRTSAVLDARTSLRNGLERAAVFLRGLGKESVFGNEAARGGENPAPRIRGAFAERGASVFSEADGSMRVEGYLDRPLRLRVRRGSGFWRIHLSVEGRGGPVELAFLWWPGTEV